MRKFVIAFFVVALMLGGVAGQTAYAMDCTQDTMFDKIGDWGATLGKKGVEKEAVLAKRKADRLAICAKKQAQEAAKAAEKAGGDLKKKLGL
ncbi:MAG: hypothetical protein KTQ49_02655 [Candidatus Omnitrophica bacterium]|nr:hypothetical protein [Candidatus Omnitrophota bacterium]